MLIYKKFLFLNSQFIYKINWKYQKQSCKHILLVYPHVNNHCLVYIVRPRNKIVSFINQYIYMVWIKSLNSIVPLKYLYNILFFWHLFIEIVGYNLFLNKWKLFDLFIKGKYNTFVYFYRYLNFIYLKIYGYRLKINCVKIKINESFGKIRRIKYPRRKRRFKRAI